MPNTHSHTPWRKSVLIPFWVFQLALELFLIAVFALAIELLVSNYDSTQSEVYVFPVSKICALLTAIVEWQAYGWLCWSFVWP